MTSEGGCFVANLAQGMNTNYLFQKSIPIKKYKCSVVVTYHIFLTFNENDKPRISDDGSEQSDERLEKVREVKLERPKEKNDNKKD